MIFGKCWTISGTIEEYFQQVIAISKKGIDSLAEEEIIQINTQELVEYYFYMYKLPKIKRDPSRDVASVPGKVYESRPYRTRQFILKYPVVLEERLDQVIKRESNPFYSYGAEQVNLNGDTIDVITTLNMNPDDDERKIKRMNDVLRRFDQIILWKNSNVESGNTLLKKELLEYVEKKKSEIKQDAEIIERVFTKIPVKLQRKASSENRLNLSVKKEIKVLMPKAKPILEMQLDQSSVIDVVSFISDACRWFERAPKVFQKLDEEDLRDIILSGLNMIFQGNATGETFSKKGKADIHLCISNGEILIAECKIWNGEKYYSEGIDQLFGYLTWRENFGILITFSRLHGFTDVIKKAKLISENHPSYVDGSLRDIDNTRFITVHNFPDDPKKEIEIHHCIFNIYCE